MVTATEVVSTRLPKERVKLIGEIAKEEKVDKHKEALLTYARNILDNLIDRKKELKKELESKITGLYLKFKEKLSK